MAIGGATVRFRSLPINDDLRSVNEGKRYKVEKDGRSSSF
jgi:hypothetical protein